MEENQNIHLITPHLALRPRTVAEMQAVRDAATDPEDKKAYGEMLELMRQNAAHDYWACDWLIALPDGTAVGGIGFKGAPGAAGTVELGYGIDAPYRRHGYATEATVAMATWALAQPGVKKVLAQTEPDNAISQKVLHAAGFVRDGMGDEGPMFSIVSPSQNV